MNKNDISKPPSDRGGATGELKTGVKKVAWLAVGDKSQPNIMLISIANDFSKYPAGRYAEDGQYNGARFRDEILIPALKEFEIVKVSFDGVEGVGSSFLEEAFGGLVRVAKSTKEFLDEHLRIDATESDLKDYVALANMHIADADRESENK